MLPQGTEIPSMVLTFSHTCSAMGFPRRRIPTKTRFCAPLFFSTISCERRIRARRMALSSMICAFCRMTAPPQSKKSCRFRQDHMLPAGVMRPAAVCSRFCRHLGTELKNLFSGGIIQPNPLLCKGIFRSGPQFVAFHECFEPHILYFGVLYQRQKTAAAKPQRPSVSVCLRTGQQTGSAGFMAYSYRAFSFIRCSNRALAFSSLASKSLSARSGNSRVRRL